MLSYGLERKQVFCDDKNVSFVRSKTWVLSKGVKPWFRSKNPKFFLVCFLVKLPREQSLLRSYLGKIEATLLAG